MSKHGDRSEHLHCRAARRAYRSHRRRQRPGWGVEKAREACFVCGSTCIRLHTPHAPSRRPQLSKPSSQMSNNGIVACRCAGLSPAPRQNSNRIPDSGLVQRSPQRLQVELMHCFAFDSANCKQAAGPPTVQQPSARLAARAIRQYGSSSRSFLPWRKPSMCSRSHQQNMVSLSTRTRPTDGADKRLIQAQRRLVRVAMWAGKATCRGRNHAFFYRSSSHLGFPWLGLASLTASKMPWPRLDPDFRNRSESSQRPFWFLAARSVRRARTSAVLRHAKCMCQYPHPSATPRSTPQTPDSASSSPTKVWPHRLPTPCESSLT